MKKRNFESLLYNAQPTGLRFPKPSVDCTPCNLCGLIFPATASKGTVAQNMIDIHGYKHVGAQVFRSVPCIACSKPGLYKVGAVAYCKEHVYLGKQKLAWSKVEIDRRAMDEPVP